jgi:hypothetical protein
MPPLTHLATRIKTQYEPSRIVGERLGSLRIDAQFKARQQGIHTTSPTPQLTSLTPRIDEDLKDRLGNDPAHCASTCTSRIVRKRFGTSPRSKVHQKST